MSKKEQPERVNMVWLAGTLKFSPKKFTAGAGCLIDCGQKQAVQVSTAKDDPELTDKLLRFAEGDFIKVVAILEPYGVKDAETGKWKNSIAVRLTEIKNEPPKRAQQRSMRDEEVPY